MSDILEIQKIIDLGKKYKASAKVVLVAIQTYCADALKELEDYYAKNTNREK